jgi:hypothetical protein
MLCGAGFGIPFGMLLNRSQPWVQDWYFWELGALVGAVLGGTITKARRDNYAWVLPGLTIAGAMVGTFIQHLKWNRSLEGAFVGFLLALAVLTVRSAVALIYKVLAR